MNPVRPAIKKLTDAFNFLKGMVTTKPKVTRLYPRIYVHKDGRQFGPFPYVDPNILALSKLMRKLERRYDKTPPKAKKVRARIMKKYMSTMRKLDRLVPVG